MSYDPFAPAENGNGERSKKLTHRRWPRIFDTELRALEWKTDARKRPRCESEAAAGSRSRVSTAASSGRRPEVNSESRRVPGGGAGGEAARAPTEPSTIMGIPSPVDDRVRSVVSFMLQNVTSANVEVEAKLGTLFEKQHERRAVELVPVMCETPLTPDSNADTRFESDVGAHVFQHLNVTLNARCVATSNATPSQRVNYVRTKEVDVYWPGRVRETRVHVENDVYETVRVQKKERLADLNVLCPGSSLDVRYSASLEEPATPPENGIEQSRRVKDRISYRFDHISVDITAAARPERTQTVNTHEVEVEVMDGAALYAEVVKYREGDGSSRLFEIATSLVTTVRLLLEESHKAVESFSNANGN